MLTPTWRSTSRSLWSSTTPLTISPSVTCQTCTWNTRMAVGASWKSSRSTSWSGPVLLPSTWQPKSSCQLGLLAYGVREMWNLLDLVVGFVLGLVFGYMTNFVVPILLPHLWLRMERTRQGHLYWLYKLRVRIISWRNEA